LPDGAQETLVAVATEIAGKSAVGTLARAVLAGGLLTLLSYLLNAVETVQARITLALMVGFLVAIGPFDHVVVSALHLLFAVWSSDAVTVADLAASMAITIPGNVIGGLVLVTLTHTAQVRAERGRSR
jgi:formate-nitrite transporter family protein